MSDEAPPAPAAAPAAPAVDPAPAAPPVAAPAAAALVQPAASGWRDSLPDALKGEAILANFNDVTALAQGYVETKRLASSRVPTPGDTPESQKAFFDAIRPADAAAYEIAVPDGMPTDYADGFRAKAHELALLPSQVKAIAEWNNEQIAAQLTAASAASQAEIDQFKADYEKAGGKFGQKLDALRAWLPNMGVQMSAEDMAQLDAKMGSANLMWFMFTLHDMIGDIPALPGDAGVTGMPGAMSPEAADKRLNELQRDAGWRAKVQVDGSAEAKEYQRLTNLIAHGRLQQRKFGARA